jgi:hypothetical protein
MLLTREAAYQRAMNAAQKPFVLPTLRQPPPRPLPPNDPDAVLGAQPLVNVVLTDENYTFEQNTFAVIATAPCTLTLADSPLTATPVLAVADGGAVTVVGGANTLQGGPVTLLQGEMAFFSFSPVSEEWSSLAGGGSGGPIFEVITSSVSVNSAADAKNTYVGFFGLTTPVTNTLPVAPFLGQLFIVGNDDGSANSTNTITLNAGANSIATTGQHTLVLNQPYQYATVVWDGRIWALVNQSGSLVTVSPLVSGTYNVRLSDNLVRNNIAGGNCTNVLPGGLGNPATKPIVGPQITLKNETANNGANSLTVVGGLPVEDPSNRGTWPGTTIVYVFPNNPGGTITYECTGTQWDIVATS